MSHNQIIVNLNSETRLFFPVGETCLEAVDPVPLFEMLEDVTTDEDIYRESEEIRSIRDAIEEAANSQLHYFSST